MSPLSLRISPIMRVHCLRALAPMALLALLSLSSIGCHDLTGNTSLPAGTQDPSFYNNATGAVGMRNAAVGAFDAMLPNYIIATGLISDELTDLSTISSTAGQNVSNGGVITNHVDERILPQEPLIYNEGSIPTGAYMTDPVYATLQGARAAILQAIGQLATYDTSAKDTALLKPAAGRALQGELYALYGYAEIMLADLFCSGIPLSTQDFQHDFTYHDGSSTKQVYRDAIAHFDTALTLVGDSTRFRYLALVGLGRAYLDLAYINPAYVPAAADDVSVVPSDYTYTFLNSWALENENRIHILGLTVSDSEGGNGLPFIASGDPRTADTTDFYTTTSSGPVPYQFPKLYEAGLLSGTFAPTVMASGIEARLIEAEAALQPGGAGAGIWLSKLEQLRESAIIPGRTALLPQQSDSFPNNLSDPGTDSARLALTFRERAFWLYLTGHRQGELRRQLRQYSRYWPDQSLVYPTGPYTGLGAGFYGTDVTAPISGAEYLNPFFHGCINREP